MINQGICYYSAVNCSSNINYENFLNQGYGAILSAVLTELSKCNKDLDEETIALCVQITRKIIKNSTKSNDFVYDISNFLNKYLWRKEVFKKLNAFVCIY